MGHGNVTRESREPCKLSREGEPLESQPPLDDVESAHRYICGELIVCASGASRLVYAISWSPEVERAKLL